MNYHIVRSTIGLIGGTLVAVALMLSCSVHPDTIQWVTYALAPILTPLMATDIVRLTPHFIDDNESPEKASQTQLGTTMEKVFSRRNFYRIVKGTVGLSVLALIAVLLLYVFVDPNADRLLARSAIVGSPAVAVGVYLLARPRVDQIVAA
jgi:hypothetical protein